MIDVENMNRMCAAPTASQPKELTPREMEVAAAPSILRRCLAGRSFSALDVWNDTPELQAATNSTISLGMALGVNCRTGLCLFEDGEGYQPVFENAAAAIYLLEDDELLRIVDALGLTREEFRARLTELEALSEFGEAMRFGYREITCATYREITRAMLSEPTETD